MNIYQERGITYWPLASTIDSEQVMIKKHQLSYKTTRQSNRIRTTDEPLIEASQCSNQSSHSGLSS